MAFQDTSIWLHNKLGTSNDSWISGSIVAQLNPETLNKIITCFQELQPQVKLKLLLSFFQIPRRNLEMWQQELDNIIAVAIEDSEPWVCMLGELMKTYPSTGQLNSDITIPESNQKIFSDLLGDLKKALKKTAEKKDIVLPLECHYLNKNAFLSVVGHQPQTTKHFSLKRKPKAAALRAELLNKSQDAANKLKSNLSGGFPVRKSTMPRKMSDPNQLKGLPSNRAIGQPGFRNQRAALPSRNPNKKEGGVKLLDIADQPIGYAAAKKRKKQQEIEESKKTTGDQPPSKEATTKEDSPSKAVATPDYAAGLNPPTPAAQLTTPAYAPPTPTPIQAPPTPAYAPPTPALQTTSAVTTVMPTPTSTPAYTPLPGPPLNLTPIPPSQQTLGPSAHMSPLPLNVVQQSNLSRNPSMLFQSLEPIPQANLQSSLNVPQLIARVGGQVQQIQQQQQMIVQQSPQAGIVQLPTQPIPQSRVAQIQSQTRPPVTILSQAQLAVTQQQQGARLVRPQQQQQQQLPPQLQPQVQPTPPQQPQTILTSPTGPMSLVNPSQVVSQQQQVQQVQQQRRSLTLTKDQMLAAQEMFRTANKVTRPEKALILGFMAGSRDNPCPHLGNVVTIKLSENQENVMENNGAYSTMIVETHFQMNYSTGEWKRIKKYRRIEEDVIFSKGIR